MKKINSQNDLKLIYDSHYKQLTTQAFRIVFKSDVAEDIVQECFVKLWNKREELEIDYTIESYLKKMVRNRCLDYLRKNKVRIVALDDNQEIEDSKAEHVEIRYQKNKELNSEIYATLNALPEKCRQVFILSRFEKLTYNEIAEKLAISPKTVEAHISRALKGFRKNLKSFLFILINKLHRVFRKDASIN